MTWILLDKEIESVLQLEASKRYSYLVKHTVDQQRLWSLCRAGRWAAATDDSGKEFVPVWPHEKYAAICAQGDWADYEPKSIDITAWIEKWLPGLQCDGRCVAVFPIPNGKGVCVDPDRMAGDLRQELSLYQ
jgi:hypothetical protein